MEQILNFVAFMPYVSHKVYVEQLFPFVFFPVLVFSFHFVCFFQACSLFVSFMFPRITHF